MLHVFLILLGVSAMFGLTFGALLLQKKVNDKNGTVIAPDQYLAVDLIVFLFLSLAFMFPIIFLAVCEVKGEPWLILVDSGILLAILLFVLGKITYLLYSVLAKRLGFSEYKKESSVVYLLSCLIYIVILLRLCEFKLALTFAAIITGRFVWFDTTWDKMREDCIGLFHAIKTMPFGTIIFMISIVVAVCVGNENFIGIVFWGNTIAFVSFMFYMTHLSKASKTGCSDVSNSEQE